MNWIQKHALSVLLRTDTASLKQMRPEGVDSNLFSYHIHYLKSNNIIESITRGSYRLTTKGMHVVGKFNSATGSEAQDVKSVIVLFAKNNDSVLLFKWSRHPYFGTMTLPHDRYNYGASLQDALAEAVEDKLGITLLQAAPAYRKSGMIHIYHADEQISCMSAHVYEVSPQHITPVALRNGSLEWIRLDSLAGHKYAMQGLAEFVELLQQDTQVLFEVSLRY